jgi:serine/threonine-protein kinase
MVSGDGSVHTLAHFRLGEKIGEGGMGVVYKATDRTLRRTVALKVLPEALAHDEDRRQRLLHEARAAAAVTHPNIATIYEVGESEGRVFIAMELVEGQSLRTTLELNGAFAVPLALRLALQIARGLARAHKAGVVHRDLKPDNVMVGENELVKLLDFGLAKVLEGEQPASLGRATTAQITREGAILGTPMYMSPEQATGKGVDARSDVFSFGVMLFEMLAGATPFHGTTDLELVVAISRDAPTPLAATSPDVPAPVAAFVNRCLEKNPAARFANGQELVDALRALSPEPPRSMMDPRSGEPAPGAAAQPTAAIMSRGPRAWRLALGGSFVLVAGAITWSYAARPPRPAAPSAPPPSAVAEAEAPRGTSLADLPAPATNVPAAASEYAAGMQALRDNSWGLAVAHFEKTVELDPTIAIAHLRLSMVEDGNPTRKREEFAKAVGLRAQLTARDRALLEALEPVLQKAHADRAEALVRLERASEAYPLDVEFLDWLGILREGDPVHALPPAEKAILLDPSDGQAWQTKGQALALLERPEEARAAFQRCADIGADSVDCVSELAALDAAAGRCDAYEQGARRVADRDPEEGIFLATAMFARGAPVAAVSEALDQVYALQEDPAERSLVKGRFDVGFATLTGDFVRAVDLARGQVARASSGAKRTELPFQLGVTAALGEALEETGQADEARKVAHDFVVRSETWATSNDPSSFWDPAFVVLKLAEGRGGLSAEEFEGRRARWIDDRLKTATVYPGLLWTFAYAATARTPEEARAAIAAAPRFAPLTSYLFGGHLDADAYVGEAYLLAGQPEEAARYLSRAVANCTALLSVGVHTRAALHLGQALEAASDTPGACAAYKIVLDRWGHARPRSVSADLARERAKALACPGL